MAAKKRSSDEVQGEHDAEAADGFDAEDEQDLYSTEIARYSDSIDRGLDEAYQRYGFTLYHSLPAVKQLELAEKSGLLKHDYVDEYNLGGAAVELGNFEAASKHFQKSLDLEGTFADAAFNLALSLERLNRKADAINSWSRFLELTSSDEDRKQVEAHLTELRA